MHSCCRCTFTSRDRDIHILLPHNEDDMMAVMPSAAREMFQCFTKVPQPPASRNVENDLNRS